MLIGNSGDIPETWRDMPHDRAGLAGVRLIDASAVSNEADVD